MEMRQLPDQSSFKRLGTEEIRATFLVDNLFVPGAINLNHFDYERAVLGSAVPTAHALVLEAPDIFRAEYFTERRELGIMNLGGAGQVLADGDPFDMAKRDSLYIGRGTQQIEFSSEDSQNPAQYYIVSYPAHQPYPNRQIKATDIEPMEIGSKQDSNERSIYQAIIPGKIDSGQLVMGFTELSTGSVWNTMPAHRHVRRMEVYLYYDLPGDAVVMHLMGQPDETRHIMVREKQAVISPSWSLHSGVGTHNYGFVWAMGGENQDYTDMDAVAMAELR